MTKPDNAAEINNGHATDNGYADLDTQGVGLKAVGTEQTLNLSERPMT
jgi:hypothetical protein